MTPTGAALLWQGFHHRWGYNHRLNRLGSGVVVERVEGDALIGHTTHSAASGTGPDRAEYATYWSELSAPGVGMYAGSVFFDLRGREGVAVSMRQRVSLPVGGLFAGRRTTEAVLGGFDLCSLGAADKLVELSMSAGKPAFDAAQGRLEFDMAATLKVNCTSGECPPFKQDFHYRLQLDYLLLAGDDELAVSAGTFGRRCEWNHEVRKSGWTVDTLQQPGLITGGRPFLRAQGAYQVAAPAFRSLRVACVSDQHLAGLELALRNAYWTPGQGCVFDLDLSFDQWRDGMKDARLPWSALSFKSNGWATLSAEVALLQLRQGRVKADSHRGGLEWAAKGASADTIEAVVSTPVRAEAVSASARRSGGRR